LSHAWTGFIHQPASALHHRTRARDKQAAQPPRLLTSCKVLLPPMLPEHDAVRPEFAALAFVVERSALMVAMHRHRQLDARLRRRKAPEYEIDKLFNSR
jgi:hypothetical protein